MKRMGAIFLFYKPMAFWSFLATIVIIIFAPYIVPAVFTKLFLIVFAWYLTSETNAKRKLLFYNNLGISTFRLFSTIFILDLMFTIPLMLLLREFT